MISGEHVPKLGKNPGRPASPRLASLAPLHTASCLRFRGNVTHSNASEKRIGCQFDRVDRKAYTKIKGPTTQCKDMSKSAIHLPGRSQAYECNVGAMEGREEPDGGRPALHVPAYNSSKCQPTSEANQSHCPKTVEIRGNPGCPAHSVPTGLTPPHTWVQYFHWSNMTCS